MTEPNEQAAAKRQTIARRIRALLAMTVANGCTEDEAVAAAQKAAGLIEQYDLTMDEVEIANYLLDICARAVRSECDAREGEWAFFRLSVRRIKRIAFRDGMADSLSKRIRALKPKTKTGTGLIVLHDALIDEEMIRRGLAIRTRRQPGSFDFDDSYLEGRDAGDLVALDPGVKPPERVAGILRDQAGEQ